MKFRARLLTLVMVLCSAGPAGAFEITVGGRPYTISVISGTFDANETTLKRTPWWADVSAAKQAAKNANLASPVNDYFDRLFAYNVKAAVEGRTVDVVAAQSISIGENVFGDFLVTASSDRAYANATLVPEIDAPVLVKVGFVLLCLYLWLVGLRARSVSVARLPDAH